MPIGYRGLPGRPASVWPFRRSLTVRSAIRIGTLACLVALGLVVVFTAFLIAVFGHPLGLGIVGALFALGPLAGLLVCVGVSRRAAVAAGPGWVGVRLLRRWRVLDLGAVRSVRVSAPRPFAGPLGVPSGEPQLLLEDAEGHQLEIGAGALAPGIAETVIEGLGPDAAVDADAAALLQRAENAEEGGEAGDGRAGDGGDDQRA
ncbi:MAG TPA: hypothetical protein VMU14_01690 [Acidimicrobiales bacterium]|nr:hypothetical protein [Acidimicrobiales bacterium]